MSSSQFRIVLVGDDKKVRWSLGSALLEAGHEVEVAGDVKGAREVIDSTTPEILFLDLDLPEEPVLDLLREVTDNHSDTVVLMLGSEATGSIASEGIKMGAVQSFAKPLDAGRIISVITDLMADSEIRQEAKRAEPIIVGNRETDRFILGKSEKMKEIFRIV